MKAIKSLILATALFGGIAAQAGTTWILPPFVVPSDLTSFAVFPVGFFDWTGSSRFNCILPAYYNHSENDGLDRTFWAAAGLGGYRREDGVVTSHWCHPLYWSRPEDRFLASPLWVRQGEFGESVQYRGCPLLLSVTGFDPREGNRFGRVLCGLAGWNVSAAGTDSHWTYPLYSHRRDRAMDALETAVGSEALEPVAKDLRGRQETSWLCGLFASEHEIDSWNVTRGDANDLKNMLVELQRDRDDKVSFIERRTFGNRFLFRRASVRKVTFSRSTFGKVADEAASETTFLWCLYRRRTTPKAGTRIEILYLPVWW